MFHTHWDGSPVSFQEIPEWIEEADGWGLNELSLCCSQSPLTVPNFQQSAPCNKTKEMSQISWFSATAVDIKTNSSFIALYFFQVYAASLEQRNMHNAQMVNIW